MSVDPAYAHYRVERTLSDVEPANRKDLGREPRPRFRPGGNRFPNARDLATDPSVAVHDVVQIFDRTGTSVWTTAFDLRADGERFEAALVDDVLHLDVDDFRAKYGLTDELVQGDATSESVRDDSGRREGDIDWGDFGQR